MVMMVLEKVPRSLKGELSRWLLEVQTGVFIGNVSATVRDLLWQKCVEKSAGGRCCQAWRTNNEQGFTFRLAGDTTRQAVDFDGLMLVAAKNAEWERMMQKRKRGANLDNPTDTPLSDTSEGVNP